MTGKDHRQSTLDERNQRSAVLRREMHKLDKEIARSGDQIDDINSDKLTSLLKKSHEHAKQVDKAMDQVTVTGTFTRLVRAGKSNVSKFVRNVGTASPADLARRMLAKYATTADVYADDDEVPLSAFNWQKLGEVAPKVYKTAVSASVDFMLGAVEPPKVKPKKDRVAKKKTPLEKESRPDEMDTGKQEDKNETSKLTEAMFERVVEHHKKPYTFFVLNHESFAQTVENMFSIAMLVGNAKVALRKDPEWGMQVQLVKGESRGQPVQPQPKSEPAQMVLNMNYDMWNALKAAVAPSACLTPHREAIQFAYAGAGGAGAKSGSGAAARLKKKQAREARLTSSDDDDDAPGPSKKAKA